MNLYRFPFRYRSVLLAGLALVGFSSFAAERYSLDSFVIAGGGGQSKPLTSRGRFAVTGTIGQALTAPVLRSPNPRYQVEPGFWHGIVIIETPDAPELKIRPGAIGHVVLSWTVSIGGFSLEETSDVAIPGSWVPTPGIVIDTATEHTVTIPAANTLKFYRLKKE